MSKTPLQDLFDQASEELDGTDIYREILNSESNKENKVKEQAIYKLGEIYAKNGQADLLGQLLTEIRPFFSKIPKAKTAKIVRELIDFISTLPNTLELQIELCNESIEWAKQEKRTFLRHRIQTKLAQLCFQAQKHAEGLEIITPLLKEVKKLDDKALLVEINLVESKIQHALRDIPKAKASLTAARTAATAIYCPPRLQGSIDMASGTLHAEEKDYKTAYSYFFESFEGYNSLDDSKNAIKALKYMLLCKIMINKAADVHSILSGKLALTYTGNDVDAMVAVANAHRERSIHKFEKALEQYNHELKDDAIIERHLKELYDTMLQQNLCRIIEPFSCVEVSHVAELIGLEVALVEKKLSQMILDKKFHGILDQNEGSLTLYEPPTSSSTYEASLEVISNMNRVVDSLFERAKEIN